VLSLATNRNICLDQPNASDDRPTPLKGVIVLYRDVVIIIIVVVVILWCVCIFFS
jgi:hypothetical protein